MRSSKPGVVVIGLAVLALGASACGADTSEPIVPSLPPLTSSATAPTDQTTTPSPAPTSAVTTPTATSSSVTAAPAAVVPCVDPGSEKVRSAVAALGTDSAGGVFEIDDHTPGTSANGCPTLEWARATGVGIGDGTVQSHIMFFTNGGRYLGTATSDAYSYTSVVSSSDTSVQVQYRWLSDDDPFCCPSNESVVSFDYNGSSVTATGQFPPKP